MADAFSLARFAPPEDVRFKLAKHGDHEFVIDADPDVDDVGRMLRLEEVMRGREEGDIEATLVEAKQLLLRMIRERDPGFGELKIGGQELVVIFTLIMNGETVAAAVLEAITAAGLPAVAAPAGGDPEEPRPGGPLEPGEDETPLGSERRSSEASSSSAATADGLQAIGTA